MADFKGLLSAVSTALSVVTKAANIPGVNLIPYVSTISSAASVLQFALERGQNVAADIVAFKDTFADGLPSEEKRDALDVRIEGLRTKLHMPLPDKEEGEPE